MDQFNHSKNVYINRNFNRISAERAPILSISNVMYFNPNFSHDVSTQHYIDQQRDHATRPRIHVNRNFIKPDGTAIGISSQKNILPTVSTADTNNQIACMQPIQAVTVDTKSIQMGTVTNSRYCLVRQSEKVVKTPLITPVPIKNTQQTVKLNKYKLVSLSSVKKSLTTVKKPIVKSKYKVTSKSAFNVQNSRFRYVKKNSSSLNSLETVQGTVRRVSITRSKSTLNTSFRQTKKNVAGAMKKNNIPCPLFKKYGKCLRMIRGSCDYLHDKKHVSICRMFLKGVCHNKNCLLSHDLTDKKMPTCYFYLQGNCTKEGCPYLHVKLNEKTKICPDFLKGYCENGDKCIHRHVNVRFNNTKSNNESVKTKKHSSATIINKNLLELDKVNEDNTPHKMNTKNITEDFDKDQRYFKEATSDITPEEQYDVIKPTRCKLGALPSFIQL